MSGKSIIKRSQFSKEEEQKYLEILNRHFKTVTREKHPNAMLNIIFNKAYEKILGPNFRKKRISKRKEKKLIDEITRDLRWRYGRWINLTHVKIKGSDSILFQTNFNRVYKVENQGMLYGSPSESICGGVFYTSHCLERFEERADPAVVEEMRAGLKKVFKTDPTSADIIMSLAMGSNLEYGKWREFCYLNIHIGALVIEDMEDIFIVKTFLPPEMLYKDMTWYQPLITEQKEKEITSFQELLNMDSVKIEKPSFFTRS